MSEGVFSLIHHKKPSRINLRDDSYTAFACYLADVIEHLEKSGVTSFQSITPMNEPATDYWSAYSEKQEGCHFSPGESQSKIITELNRELQNKGIDIIMSSSDETSINATISSYKKLSPEAKDALARLDTHTYHGNKRKELKETALDAGKNLWMSEVDGTFSLGKESGAMENGENWRDVTDEDNVKKSNNFFSAQANAYSITTYIVTLQ